MLLAVALAAGARAEPVGERAGAVFQRHCAGCHGDTGRADGPDSRALKVQPLVDDRALARKSPAEIVALIRSNPKHESLKAVESLDPAALEDAAAFVRALAETH